LLPILALAQAHSSDFPDLTRRGTFNNGRVSEDGEEGASGGEDGMCAQRAFGFDCVGVLGPAMFAGLWDDESV
jgi:hypothetical protein